MGIGLLHQADRILTYAVSRVSLARLFSLDDISIANNNLVYEPLPPCLRYESVCVCVYSGTRYISQPVNTYKSTWLCKHVYSPHLVHDIVPGHPNARASVHIETMSEPRLEGEYSVCL